MVYKVLRWLIGLTGLFLLLLVIGLTGLYFYVDKHRDRVIKEAAAAAGMEVHYRALDLFWWEEFPRLTFTVDSLILRDTAVLTDAPPLLALDSIRLNFSVDALLSDTLRLQKLTITGGRLHLERDTAGRLNFGSLFTIKDTTESGQSYAPELDWAGVELNVRDLEVLHRDPLKNKLFDFRLDSLKVVGNSAPDGDLLLESTLAAYSAGIAMNTEKGTYLSDSPLNGKLSARVGKDSIFLYPTTLTVSDQAFDFAATIDRNTGTTHLTIANDSVYYEQTRPLLHDQLRAKLANYHVDGPFPVSAELTFLSEEPRNPEIRINFEIVDRGVKILQYPFTRVFTSGQMINRLSGPEGGTAGGKKDLRIQLDSTRGFLDGRILVTTPKAVLASRPGKTNLESSIQLSGPATELGRQLKNRDFLFKRGRFDLDINVNASLDHPDELVAETDGRLQLYDVGVFYRPAGATLPFLLIDLNKRGQDVNFHIDSKPLPTGFAFKLKGRLDNLTPLIIDQPGEALTTEVSLTSTRIDWTDYLAFFGDGGYFEAEEVDTTLITPAQTSMRKTLLGLRKTFRPKIDARFDTVAYFDVFTLTDFSTGLHFSKDTLILKHTTFDWAGSELRFGAKLDLGQERYTHFRLNAHADHLDLNALKPSLDYFGLRMPAELAELPNDLTIQFSHQGRLDDTAGIVPGYNAGQLVFDDGRDRLFSGNMTYAPVANSLHTDLQLRGDPRIVNFLFGSEDFFFGSGHFELTASLENLPANLAELVAELDLQLQIDSSRLEYRPGGIYLPIRSFAVDVRDKQTDFDLRFLTDSTRHEVRLNGSLDDLSAFLLPAEDQVFKVAAQLKAPLLQFSDFTDLISFDPKATPANGSEDNTSLLSSATAGAFQSFRPDLLVEIDTFLVGERRAMTDIFAHLHLHDSLGLVLEDAGFSLGEGRVNLNAHYGIDAQENVPFALDWKLEKIDFRRVMEELNAMKIILPADLAELGGQLNSSGSLRGRINPEDQGLLPSNTQGQISFQLDGVELSDSPFLAAIGKKAKMKKRFQHLRFSPLAGDLQLDSGRVYIPRLEIQNTGVQLFVEGYYDLVSGPDLLISLPLRNIGRGVLSDPPLPTGYAHSGWKVYLVNEAGKDGKPKTKFRLGRRRFYKQRGRLEEFRLEKRQLREERREKRNNN
ncbi:hypothetical protein CEQ90_02485 [Lewinellaceae bacterium SD302]|nr:hypothetical protein CEQ90_02485 [Lewinellaceae bacterium SD302]